MPTPEVFIETFDPTNRPGAKSFYEFGSPPRIVSPYLNADGTPNPDSITKLTPADVNNPNPSYIPKVHERPLDGTINTKSPSLEPLHGLHATDFDQLISNKSNNPELSGYDPQKFLRIRQFFLKIALKSPEKMAEKRKDAELLTAKIWNEAAAASISRSPFGTGAVHESEWYKRNGSPDLKLMNRFSRPRRIASGISGHGGVARLQKKAKFIANAEQQPVARAVERARKNNDTSRNAKNNEAFLELTKHHVEHANHEALDRVKGTESAKILRHPIKKVAGAIRNRGKLGSHLVAERENNLRAQKLEELTKAQERRATEKAQARAAKQRRRQERRNARTVTTPTNIPNITHLPTTPALTERSTQAQTKKTTVRTPATPQPRATNSSSIDVASLPLIPESDKIAESLNLQNGNINMTISRADGTEVKVTDGRIVESRKGKGQRADGTEFPTVGYRIEYTLDGAVNYRWVVAEQLNSWNAPKTKS